MSSMRNAVQRRNHKERAQPKQREKWGLLEKHKDYSLRAKDYNEKKRRLKLLRQKAADRNPDEFHFAMMSSKTDSRGIKIADRGNQVLSPEAVALLKTQDAGYVRTVLQKTRKAIERLEQTLSLAESGSRNLAIGEDDEDKVTGRKHIAFVEDAAEQQQWTNRSAGLSKDLADKLQADPSAEYIEAELSEDEEPQLQPKKKKAISEEDTMRLARMTRKRKRRNEEIRRSTLKILRKRERDLRAAEIQLDAQRSKMNGGHGIGVTKKGVTFKSRARKR